MNPIDKTVLRAAVFLRDKLTTGEPPKLDLYLPEWPWDYIQKIRRRIDVARRRNWRRAAACLTEDLAAAINGCRQVLDNAVHVLQSRPAKPRVASAVEIYRDLQALDDEFEAVGIDVEKQLISVTTDRIALEGVYLGPFKICLDWSQLDALHPYHVVALDPDPAATNDEVTHPHVQNEHLCEGEGHVAIEAALAEGRLYDFFLLVSQVLHTYGCGSAYVELDDWDGDGVSCNGCGDSISEDDRYYCQSCGSTVCDGCSSTCMGCDELFCSDCLSECIACGKERCRSCLKTCRVCGKQFCEDCREGDLCLSCHKKQQNEEHEHDPSEKARREPVAVGA
jgi:hypothetical protein